MKLNCDLRTTVMHDISKDLEESNPDYKCEDGDVWTFTPNLLFNKETRLLNNKLGIHKVNKYGEKMGGRRISDKKIIQYDLNFKPIKEWSCVKEASEKLQIPEPTIRACLNKQTKNRDFFWKYKQ